MFTNIICYLLPWILLWPLSRCVELQHLNETGTYKLRTLGRITIKIEDYLDQKQSEQLEQSNPKLFVSRDWIDDKVTYYRKMYAGKTLWFTQSQLRVDDGGENMVDGTGSPRLWPWKRLSPIKILDVIRGPSPNKQDHLIHEISPSNRDAPASVRFMMRTPSGVRLYFDLFGSGPFKYQADTLDYSWGSIVTALGQGLPLPEHYTFDDYFLTKDPHVTYKWSTTTWAAIDRSAVIVGMTAKQVELAWGWPGAIHSTVTRHGKSQQWIFGGSRKRNRYVYLDNDVVTAIQD